MRARTRPLGAVLAGALLAGMVALGNGASAQSTTTTDPALQYPYTAPSTTTAPPLLSPVVPVRHLTGPKDIAAYSGFGTWLDVYDWSATWHKVARTRTTLADIDRMATAGVQTLYIQTGKWDAPGDVVEPQRLLPLVARAKARGMAVVAWYLPTFENLDKDLRRLVASAAIPGVDALGVDIESKRVRNLDLRNQRVVELSRRLRAALPGMALAGIPYPPVLFEQVNLKLWPSFPWLALAPHYDVWMPMSYQSDRKVSSGYRDGYRYTAANVDLLRARLGPTTVVHSIGGIANRTSVADVEGIVRAAGERGVIGGSLYDWSTTPASLLPALRLLRNPTRP